MKHIIIAILGLLITQNAWSQNNIEEGKKLFKNTCSSCHAVDKKLVGPALKGVSQRRENKWLIEFIQSSQTLIKKGDAEAVAIYNEYSKTVMPDHKNLSHEQINNILAYLDEEPPAKAPENVTTITYTLPVAKPYKDKKSFLDKVVYLNLEDVQKPIKKDEYLTWFLIASFVVLLIILFNILVYRTSIKKNFKQRAKEAKSRIS